MAASKYNAYKNLVLGAIMLFFTLSFLKNHYLPEGKDLMELIVLRESGAKTAATITNYKELEKGEKTLKYTYVVKGETYRGTYKMRGNINGSEVSVPVTYNLRRPQVHQYNLQEALQYAQLKKNSALGWKFYIFPIGAFLMLYWGFGELRQLKEEARTQDAEEG